MRPDIVGAKEELEKKNAELEKQFAKKCEALEMNYDEVRHETGYDRFGDWRKENDMDMVLRLVHMKTGIWIQECDVIACHPLGKRERNTYILCVNNRTPYSGWDIITKGMVTAENNFTWENVFINFQLTKKRGEICKEVRRAKKENLIKNYDINANGRIFIKNLGNDTNNKNIEIVELEDIKKYFSI